MALAGTNYFTLKILSDDLKLKIRPLLVAKGSTKNGEEYMVEHSGKGGERLKIPLTVINVSENLAFKLNYDHDIKNDNEIKIPRNEDLQSRYEDMVVLPKVELPCGWDDLYKQEFMDGQKEDKDFYQHFYFKYCDELGNEYSYYSIWKIRKIIEGEVDAIEMLLEKYSRIK